MNLTNAIVYFETMSERSDKPRKVTAIQYEDGSGNNFNIQFDGGDWEFHRLPDTDSLAKLVTSFSPDSLESFAGWKEAERDNLLKEVRDVTDMNYLWEFYTRPVVDMSINNVFVDRLLRHTKQSLIEVLTFQASKSDNQMKIANQLLNK